MIKTDIIEIDDLIAYLKIEYLNNERSTSSKEPHTFDEYEPLSENVEIIQPKLSDEQYDEFTRRMETLSKAEKAIFDMYIQGYSAKQICQMKFYSIHTIKSHNTRIYSKLNVSSKV